MLTQKYEKWVGEIIGQPVKILSEKTRHSHIYDVIIESSGEKVSSFVLRPMPGCHAICISHAVEVFEPYRNKGVGSTLEELRYEVCKTMNIATIICTVVSTNSVQIRIMEKKLWQRMFELKNPKNNNTVLFFKKDL